MNLIINKLIIIAPSSWINISSVNKTTLVYYYYTCIKLIMMPKSYEYPFPLEVSQNSFLGTYEYPHGTKFQVQV